jgi:hypothetical protein
MTYDDTPTGKRMVELEARIDRLEANTLNVFVAAHGPIDGRHIIIIDNEEDEMVVEAILAAVTEHFSRAWIALNPDVVIDAAAVIPLVVFGDIRIEPAE